MTKKGTKLTAKSKAAIGTAVHRRKEARRAQLELIIRGNRVYVRSLGNNAISVEVDVTPVWHFFKGAMAHKARGGAHPKPTDPDYDEVQASQ